MGMSPHNDYASIAAVRVRRNIHNGYPVLTMRMVGRRVVRMSGDRCDVSICSNMTMRDHPKDNGTSIASVVTMLGSDRPRGISMGTLPVFMRGNGDI
jgi:hypothetical protein